MLNAPAARKRLMIMKGSVNCSEEVRMRHFKCFEDAVHMYDALYARNKKNEEFNFDCGMTVHFKSKVFQEPYAPFYDAYKGHTFRIINIHEGDHCELVCISDTSVIVAGNVHKDELKQT
jgi:hypothetical protein